MMPPSSSAEISPGGWIQQWAVEDKAEADS